MFGGRDEKPLEPARTKRRSYWKVTKDLQDWEGSHTSKGTQSEARKSEPKVVFSLSLSLFGTKYFLLSLFPLHVFISFYSPVFSLSVNTWPYKPQLWSDLSAHKPKIELSLQVLTETWLLQQSHRWTPLGQTTLWFNQSCLEIGGGIIPFGHGCQPQACDWGRHFSEKGWAKLQKASTTKISNRKLNLGFFFLLLSK